MRVPNFHLSKIVVFLMPNMGMITIYIQESKFKENFTIEIYSLPEGMSCDWWQVYFRHEWMWFTKWYVWQRCLHKHDGFLQMWLWCRLLCWLKWQMSRLVTTMFYKGYFFICVHDPKHFWFFKYRRILQACYLMTFSLSIDSLYCIIEN